MNDRIRLYQELNLINTCVCVDMNNERKWIIVYAGEESWWTLPRVPNLTLSACVQSLELSDASFVSRRFRVTLSAAGDFCLLLNTCSISTPVAQQHGALVVIYTYCLIMVECCIQWLVQTSVWLLAVRNVNRRRILSYSEYFDGNSFNLRRECGSCTCSHFRSWRDEDQCEEVKPEMLLSCGKHLRRVAES